MDRATDVLFKPQITLRASDRVIHPRPAWWESRCHQRYTQPGVPRIHDAYLECVVYLYPSEKDAEEGARAGGSGFLVAVPSTVRPRHVFMFIVTNRHVVEGGATTVRLNTTDGKAEVRTSDERMWLFHPDGDDLAILPVAMDPQHQYKFIGVANFLTKETIDELDIGPGDDVFVVGRFINHEGRQKNLPTLRFGNIAQMDHEPLQTKDGFMQETYLVEARSIGGYSGSPVFVYLEPFANGPPKRFEAGKLGPWLLGIDWCHLNDWKPVCDEVGRPIGRPADAMQVGSNTGMMGVIPVRKLNEMLNLKQVKDKMQEIEDEILREQGAPSVTTDSASVPAPNRGAEEAPDHREAFNRLVAAASKSKPKDDRT